MHAQLLTDLMPPPLSRHPALISLPALRPCPLYTTSIPGGAPYTVAIPPPHGSSGKTPSPAAARTAIYPLILVFGLAANALSPFALLTYFSDFYFSVVSVGMAFAGIAIPCSLFTWIWASILLSYNRRLYSTDTITRASAHCISTMVLSIVWLAIAIGLFATGAGCLPEAYPFSAVCQFNLSLAMLALSLFILLGSVSLFILVRTKNYGVQVTAVNVAQFDENPPRPTMQMMPVAMQPFGYGHQVGVQRGGKAEPEQGRSGPNNI
ncbi:hypothetical protein V5O48_006591 [Marasmius crinis-equi]|uniref:Uncharacterized protein n=1 Tax=Marasmius crinis-equi TaxID=585013 RepID=A0ABR3FJ20_9AGAR